MHRGEFVFEGWEEHRGQSGRSAERMVGSWNQVEGFHQARRNCKDVGGNVRTIHLRTEKRKLSPWEGGGEGRGQKGRVCSDPLAMTRTAAVELNRASLREYWQM